MFVTVGFDDGSTCYFYNAGMDPAAREISPGVTGTAAYLRDRLEAGRRASTSCGATRATSTSGARSTNPSIGC